MNGKGLGVNLDKTELVFSEERIKNTHQCESVFSKNLGRKLKLKVRILEQNRTGAKLYTMIAVFLIRSAVLQRIECEVPHECEIPHYTG